MSVTIYNTLTRQKETFEPITPGHVHIYVCGPTVYGHAHLGHAKSYICFDTVVRYFRYLDYKVKYVQNITDVGHLVGDSEDGEDKILKQARAEEVDPMQVAQTYTWSYFDDMDALGVQRPDISPQATGHITEQISLIEKLIERGFAYESNGSVYFDVRKVDGYGNLSGRKIDELEAGARLEVNPEKRFPGDFSLWIKAAPNHLMDWPSPWSEGYPGWHIECSAMSMKYLGETFDIHGGGIDNIFPHHECEIAQSIAATGKPFARYWMHNNMISMNAEKMSKSLGNVLNVKDLLKKYSAYVIRHFILNTHYRGTAEFSDDAMHATIQGNQRLQTAFANIAKALENGDTHQKDNPPVPANDAAHFRNRGEAAMNDDFNTAQAIAVLFDASKTMNQYLQDNTKYSQEALQDFYDLFSDFGHQVLGILPPKPQVAKGESISEVASGLIEFNIALRNQMRQEKNWKAADQIRDQLKTLGVTLVDHPDGTTKWEVE